MLNTNSPQEINNDVLGGRIDQRLGQRDQLFLRYDFLAQKVKAFQFVKGQNPDTQTRSHLARTTWTRAWSPRLRSPTSRSIFRRVGSLLAAGGEFIGMRVSISGVCPLGPGNSIPIDRAQNDYSWAGKVSSSRGPTISTRASGVCVCNSTASRPTPTCRTSHFDSNFGTDGLTNMRLGCPSNVFARRR